MLLVVDLVAFVYTLDPDLIEISNIYQGYHLNPNHVSISGSETIISEVLILQDILGSASVLTEENTYICTRHSYSKNLFAEMGFVSGYHGEN